MGARETDTKRESSRATGSQVAQAVIWERSRRSKPCSQLGQTYWQRGDSPRRTEPTKIKISPQVLFQFYVIVCVCVCAHTQTHTHIYRYIRTYLQVYINIQTYTYIVIPCVCVCVCKHTYRESEWDGITRYLESSRTLWNAKTLITHS